MKLFILIIVNTIFANICISQSCNTEIFKSRKFTKFTSEKDKILGIRMLCRMEYLWLQKTSKQAEEAVLYIKEQNKNGDRIDLTKYIDQVKETKSNITTSNQLKETSQLDIYVYCYFTRIEKFYEDTEKAYLEKNLELIHKIGNEFATDIQEKGKIIIYEIQRIEKKYPY